MNPAEFRGEVKRVPVSAALGDLLDRQLVLQQQRAGVFHPQADDVFERRFPDVAAEQPEERRWADPAPGGQLLRRHRLRVMPVEPGDQPRQLRRNFAADPVGREFKQNPVAERGTLIFPAFRAAADQLDHPVEQRFDLRAPQVPEHRGVAQVEGVEQRNQRRSRHADRPLERAGRQALHAVVGPRLDQEQIACHALLPPPELGERKRSPGHVFERKKVGVLAFPPAARGVFVLPGEHHLKRPLRRRNVEHGEGEVVPRILAHVFPEQAAAFDGVENFDHA